MEKSNLLHAHLSLDANTTRDDEADQSRGKADGNSAPSSASIAAPHDKQTAQVEPPKQKIIPSPLQIPTLHQQNNSATSSAQENIMTKNAQGSAQQQNENAQVSPMSEISPPTKIRLHLGRQNMQSILPLLMTPSSVKRNDTSQTSTEESSELVNELASNPPLKPTVCFNAHQMNANAQVLISTSNHAQYEAAQQDQDNAQNIVQTTAQNATTLNSTPNLNESLISPMQDEENREMEDDDAKKRNEMTITQMRASLQRSRDVKATALAMKNLQQATTPNMNDQVEGRDPSSGMRQSFQMNEVSNSPVEPEPVNEIDTAVGSNTAPTDLCGQPRVEDGEDGEDMQH